MFTNTVYCFLWEEYKHNSAWAALHLYATNIVAGIRTAVRGLHLDFLTYRSSTKIWYKIYGFSIRACRQETPGRGVQRQLHTFHCDLKVSRSHEKIFESFGQYFLKIKANNKCVIVLNCTCKGLHKSISELER